MFENALRLRLRIQRNGLPETKIIFLFNASRDTTISKFLEQVNDIIPLEADDWGLEDYVVELPSPNGTSFECLHFQPVSGLLEKDEEVIIRSLSPEDIKKRQISGRSQISNDGRHLLDGVPYGRPLLKRPRNRPSIHISPRKKRKFGKGTSTSLVRFHEPESQQYEEPDEDYNSDSVENGEGTSDDSDNSDDSDFESELGADELQLLKENASMLEGPEQNIPGTATLSANSISSETSSFGNSDNSSADSSEDDSSDGGHAASENNTKATESDSDDGAKTSEESEAESDTRNREGADKDVEIEELLQETATNDAEYPQGKVSTRKRNARRRAKRAMERVRKETLLYRAEDGVAKALLQDSQAESAASQTSPANGSGPKTTQENFKETSLAQREQRRLTLDAAASRRIMLSVLGIRSPKKAPAEEGALKTSTGNDTSASKSTKYVCSANTECLQNPPSENGCVEHWSERINYRAVECCDSNVCLSEPPFPFVQRWGKQSRQRNNKKKGKHEKMDERGDNEDNPDHDTSFLQGRPINLNTESDFPPLPDDLSTLPVLLANEVVAGMIITWKRWVLSKKTNWQPSITDTTGLVFDVKDGGAVLQVHLSRRDQLFEEEDIVYDEETGERVYDRFDVPADGEEDDGDVDLSTRELSFSELIEPRLLQCPAAEN